MKIERPLVPGFLKRAEQKLLLNKPGIWSTRTHLVAYYGALFILALAGLCFLERNDVRDHSSNAYWVGFIIIIAIIAFTVWLIYLLRFNVFKKYGQLHPLYMLVTFGLYFISVGTIVLFCFVHPVVESIRANTAFSSDEIVDDINAINLKVCQFESGSLHVRWKPDSVIIVKNKKEVTQKVYYDEDVIAEADTVASGHVFPYVILDSAGFNSKRAVTDSLHKINDSLYVMYNTPGYALITPPYELEKYAKHKILSSFDIYKQVYQNPQTTIDREALGKEISVLLQKYRYPVDLKYHYVEYEKDDSPFEIVHKKYQLYNIGNSLSNIVRKKYSWNMPDLADFLRIFYYFTLGITLLIFIFRQSTIRTFFLSLLAGVLLTIFTAMLLSFLNANDTDGFALIATYFILFFLGTLTTWTIKKRRVVTGIIINLFVFLVPVFPLIIYGWYVEWKRHQYYKMALPEIERPTDYDKYLIYVETGGALLLLVLLATYISKLYRRWYSLPED
jgi:hypothetical protein